MHRFYGDSLAQQVEHIPFKDGVVGSNPTRITKKIADILSAIFLLLAYVCMEDTGCIVNLFNIYGVKNRFVNKYKVKYS